MKIKLNWKAAAKPVKIVQSSASHYTFKQCTSECGN